MTTIDIHKFAPLLPLRNNWRIIAEECCALDRENSIDVSAFKSREQVAEKLKEHGPSWIRGWDGYNGWLNWGIILNYQFPLGDAGLPKTSEFLRSIPGLKFAGISLLKGGTLLREHMHPEMKSESLLTFHLGLEVPPECYLNVNGNFEAEKAGRVLIFDGSLPHYAFNASDKDRLILYCEFSPKGIALK